MRIKLLDLCGKDCCSVGEGQKLYQLIFPEIRKGSLVELDFEGIESLLTPFLNTGFGRLFDYFDKDTIIQKIIFCHISPKFLKKVNEFLDRADRMDTDKVHRETMEELFEEDSMEDFDGQ